MNSHKKGESQGLPQWLTITVVLSALVFLGYSIVVFGPEGYPIDMMLGGIIGAYAGVDQLIKSRQAKAAENQQTPPDGTP